MTSTLIISRKGAKKKGLKVFHAEALSTLRIFELISAFSASPRETHLFLSLLTFFTYHFPEQLLNS